MARLATLAVLLLSLLAVASCRVLETTSDDQGLPNAVLLTQDDQSDAAADVTLPALPTPARENIVLSHGAPTPMLRLPSHRSTCRLHRHLWWTRHHGLARVHPAVDVVPAELARGEDQEPREAVAEPDPDSRPDTDAEQKPLHGEEDEEEEAAKAWKAEMLRRFRHGIRFHHRHHEQDVEEHDDHEQDKDEGTNMDLLARFHHHHHLRHHHKQDAEDEEDGHRQDKDEGLKTKLFRRFHHHHHAHDSENEVDEVEELARKLGEAIVRRSFSHGGRHHHHHHHHGAEGGVRNWFKGLLNRF
ncbi:sarcoplasmic reticulum histidine-rich calcium-binding protein-like [Hordeum vulgare subsp. vulgare]|uniref:sarcoplasmic reticulum histidine-rich calcium-binding protein-like n=1 Tax=Hordeum vulgare subsp. vulgare TaxID=112509 RepID=UPI001D1A3D75|nr:sarcoplasmic reticulum histidine-rich calcium-binding protein-like [Hordeum vulgare subsp. vulgare]